MLLRLIFISVLLQDSLPAAEAVTLLRAPLTDPNAICNDGSQAVYYHQQDVRAAGKRVLVILAASGFCSSSKECTARCAEEPHLCGAPRKQILEKEGGIWSNELNPFADHFKVFVPSCSSDSFSGHRAASDVSGGLHFQGGNIIQAVLDDLETRLGAATASLVLVGSGDSGKGVVEACDKLGREREGRLRCIVDGGDLLPWWVEGEEEGCRESRQLEKENQQVLWGGGLCNDVERCGPLAQRWSSPLLVISAQLDVAQYKSNSCPLPLESEALTLAWRGGVVALAEARALEGSISMFVPNCLSTRPLLAGHWNTSAPVLGSKTQEVSLREVVESWLRGIHVQAVDPVAEENLSCQQGPSAPLTACRTGIHCAGWTSSYAYSGYSPKLSPPTYLFPSSYSRSCTLDPYWPSCIHSTKFEPATLPRASHSHDARNHLHPVVSSHAVGAAAAEGSRRERLWQKVQVLNHLRQLYKKYKDAYAEEYHGIGEAPVIHHTPVARPTIVRPQVITPVVERPTVVRPTVVRPTVVRPSVVRPNVVQPSVVRPTVVRASVVRPSVARRPVQGIPPVLTPDYEYDYSDYDYSDYPAYDYYDYIEAGNVGVCSGGCGDCANGCGPALGVGCPGKCAKVNPCGVAGCQGNLFARIVKAAREKRRQKGRRGGLLKELVEALERENIDYEDFGRIGRNLEERRGKKERQGNREKVKRL